jgi:hypothetical protein
MSGVPNTTIAANPKNVYNRTIPAQSPKDIALAPRIIMKIISVGALNGTRT